MRNVLSFPLRSSGPRSWLLLASATGGPSLSWLWALNASLTPWWPLGMELYTVGGQRPLPSPTRAFPCVFWPQSAFWGLK